MYSVDLVSRAQYGDVLDFGEMAAGVRARAWPLQTSVRRQELVAVNVANVDNHDGSRLW